MEQIIIRIFIGIIALFAVGCFAITLIFGIAAQRALNDRNRELKKEGKFMDKWGRVHRRG